MFRQKKTAWLWLSADEVRIAVVSAGMAGRRAETAHIIRRNMREELASWFERHPGVGEVHIVLPAECFVYRQVVLPFSDAARIRQVLPIQVESDLPFSPAGAWTAFHQMGRSGDGYRIVAAILSAHRRDDVMAMLPPGLPVKGLWSSMSGLLARMREDALGHLVWWSDGRHAMAAMEQGGILTVRAADTTGSDAKTWTGLVASSLAGGQGTSVDMRRASEILPLTVSAGGEGDADGNAFWPLFALGLAPSLPETGNFWRHRTEPEEIEARGRTRRRTLAGVALLLVLAGADLWARALVASRYDAAAKHDNRRVFAEVLPDVLPVDEAAQLRSALKGIQQEMDSLRGPHRLPPGALETIQRLLQSVNGGVDAVTEVSIDDRKLEVRGEARNLEVVSQWVERVGLPEGMKPSQPVKWEPRGFGGLFTVTWEWEGHRG